MIPLGVKWKAFWIRNRAKIFCAVLAALVAWLATSSSLTTAGKGGMTEERYEKQERNLKKHCKELKEEAKANGTYCDLKKGVWLISEEEVRRYATKYLNGYTDWLIATCHYCESHHHDNFANSCAVSSNGLWHGYCQFLYSTFIAWGGDPTKIYDWQEQVRVVGLRIKEFGIAKVEWAFSCSPI